MEYDLKVKQLCEALQLKNKPIAIHVYETKEELPEDCYLPYRDDGKHYAMCQLISCLLYTSSTSPFR